MMINQEQLDAIKETLNISAGQSANALSSLLGCRVIMEVPEIRFVEIKDLKEILMRETERFVSFFSNFENSFRGYIISAYPDKEKSKLVEILNKKYGVSVGEDSLLEEVSNIVFGAFVGALANFSGISVSFSPPKKLLDMSEVYRFSNSFVIFGEVVLLPEIDGRITSKIMVIPTRESLLLLLDKLRGLLE